MRGDLMIEELHRGFWYSRDLRDGVWWFFYFKVL